MFGTTLVNEFVAIANTFEFGLDAIEQLMINAVNATLLEDQSKLDMKNRFKESFLELKNKELDFD